MLAELIAQGQHAIQQHLPFHHNANKDLDIDEVADGPDFSLAGMFEGEDAYDVIVLKPGDSANWAAGLLYAYTKQFSEDREYILSCSIQVDKLDTKLARAYKKYGKEEYESGNQKMMRAEKFFRESMTSCENTNEMFEEMAQTAHDFFAQENWRDIVRENYQANKVLADHQWALGLDSWNRGVYFDAGMFYGRSWSILATGKI